MKTEKEIYEKLTKIKEISAHCGYTRADLDMVDTAMARVIDQEVLDAKISCLSWILGVIKTRKEIETQIETLDGRVKTGRWSEEANMSFRHEIRSLRWVLGVGPSDWKM